MIPLYGSYDALLRSCVDVFHEGDCTVILETFSRERLIELFRSGHTSVSCKARHKSRDGVYRSALISCLFGATDTNGSVRAYIVIRPDEPPR